MQLSKIATVVLAAASLAMAGDAPRGGNIRWEKDVERGLREALETDRPAMLYFTDDR